MVGSLFNTYAALGWAFVLIFLVIYLFAVVFVQTVAFSVEANHLSVTSEGDDGHEEYEHLLKFFGSMENAMWSLFYVISGGLDWCDVMEPLVKVEPVMRLVFGFYIFVMVFGMLNVLVGVFCGKASEVSYLDRDLGIQKAEDQLKISLDHLRGVFREIDRECTGEITWQQFKAYIQDEVHLKYFLSQGLDVFDARRVFKLFDEIDDTPSESMDLDSFVFGMLRLEGSARSAHVVMDLMESRKHDDRLSEFVETTYLQLQQLQQRTQKTQSVTSATMLQLQCLGRTVREAIAASRLVKL